MGVVRRRRPSAGLIFWRKLTKPRKAIWDVGSVRTRVMVKDRLVFDQPSALAVRQDTGEVTVVGNAAYAQVGVGNSIVRVEFPVVRGTIADAELAAYWLHHIRRQLWPNRRWLPFSFSPGGSFISPPGIGAADRAEWISVFGSAGLHFVSPSVGLVGLPLLANLPDSELFWVIVMGGDHSVVAVIQDKKIIKSRQIAWGGVQLSESLQFWLASEKGITVSWKTTEDLKLHHASLIDNSIRKISVRGKNPATQLGMSCQVTLAELQAATQSAGQGLILQLKQFLASLPSGQATDCIENGLWLVGGTARLSGVDSWLAAQLGCSVSVVPEPETALLRAESLHATT